MIDFAPLRAVYAESWPSLLAVVFGIFGSFINLANILDDLAERRAERRSRNG